MNKFIVFLAGFVFAAVLFTTFSFASAWQWPWDRDAVQMAPNRTPGTIDPSGPFINAHECRADATCEVNDINVAGTVLMPSMSWGANARYMCLRQGIMVPSPVPCGARSQADCASFTDEMVNRVVHDATWEDGVVFKEGELVFRHMLVVLQGEVLELNRVYNSSVGYDNDEISFINIRTGEEFSVRATSEGKAIVYVGGIDYPLTYSGTHTQPDEDKYVVFDYPRSFAHAKLDFSVCF
ncbi:MAG: hypothetical protein AABX53_01020 [Nanoarchaeota archaeon]